jgi:hypothetical protein
VLLVPLLAAQSRLDRGVCAGALPALHTLLGGLAPAALAREPDAPLNALQELLRGWLEADPAGSALPPARLAAILAALATARCVCHRA